MQYVMRVKRRQLILSVCVALFAAIFVVQLLKLIFNDSSSQANHSDKHYHRTKVRLVDSAGHVVQVNTGRSFLPSFLQNGEESDGDDGIDYEQVFELRRRHAYRACLARNRTGFETFQDIELAPFDNRKYKWIFADDLHKVIYCSVPKAASTSWKKWFLVASNSTNLSSPNEVSHDEANRFARLMGNWTNFKPLWWFSRENATEKLKTYKKMIWVRDPYVRLVSAWRSKFFSQNIYYSRVGRAIVHRYRPNATETERKTGWPVTFEEFLKYVRDEPNPFSKDVHWNIMSDFCFFCDIPYDYIGHYENLLPEANYVIGKLTKRTDVPFPFKDRVRDSQKVLTEANYTEFNRQVPRELLKQVLNIYHQDYDIFGYEWPKF